MKYPYFVYPALVELKQNPTPEKAAELKKFIAVNVGDTETLARLIGNLDEDINNFYPDQMAVQLTTDDTIDSFIEKFGKSASGGETVDSILSDAHVASDYFTADKREKPETPPELPEDPMEKVKKMVKNRDYEGAVEIMESIYLNNPKKSIYFADQIRFIRKMMINERKKQQ